MNPTVGVSWPYLSDTGTISSLMINRRVFLLQAAASVRIRTDLLGISVMVMYHLVKHLLCTSEFFQIKYGITYHDL